MSKFTIRLKHLRGQHDQRDHAWNRGMGGGGTGVELGPNQMGPVPTMQWYQKRRAEFSEMVRNGEMTRTDMRNQLRELRGMIPKPSRREEAGIVLALQREDNNNILFEDEEVNIFDTATEIAPKPLIATEFQRGGRVYNAFSSLYFQSDYQWGERTPGMNEEHKGRLLNSTYIDTGFSAYANFDKKANNNIIPVSALQEAIIAYQNSSLDEAQKQNKIAKLQELISSDGKEQAPEIQTLTRLIDSHKSLAAMYDILGYNALPKQMSINELIQSQDIIRGENDIPFLGFRNFNGTNSNDNTNNGDEYVQSFLIGDTHRVGTGVFGMGTYFTGGSKNGDTDADKIKEFVNGYRTGYGSDFPYTFIWGIAKNAQYATNTTNDSYSFQETYKNEFEKRYGYKEQDFSLIMAALGYDAFQISPGIHVLLNRGVVVVGDVLGPEYSNKMFNEYVDNLLHSLNKK
jgi:hypothetical protein